ncbi:MAG: L-threonylcarbamoyladenylate synthase, partial [Desulfobacterales bacterium]
MKEGGVVLFPTRCLYGLATDASNLKSVERIFRIKRRSFQNPLSVLIKDKNDTGGLVQHVSPEAS